MTEKLQEPITPTEREWTDDLGTYYEARAVGRNGMIYKQVVLRSRFGGGPSRADVFENVRRAAEASLSQEQMQALGWSET
jgi:hypothetical protein